MDHCHARRLALFEAGVQGVGDATGQQWHLFGVGSPSAPTSRIQSPLGRHHCTAIADDEKLRDVGFQMALGGVQNPLVEAAGKSLLGAEHDDDMPLGTSHLCAAAARIPEREASASPIAPPMTEA